MGVQIGKEGIALVFTYVFVTMLALAPVFSGLVALIPRKKLLPWLYLFFALNLVGFYFVFAAAGQQTPIIAKVFYVWVSVFNLFVVSVFWSFMADIFKVEQAQRLYGFIAAGGTAGAIAGPLLTRSLVTQLGPKNLMLVSAVFLVLAVALIYALVRWEAQSATTAEEKAENLAEDKPIGGSAWAGLRDVLTSPYLLGISSFLIIFSLLSSLMYVSQLEMLGKAYTDSVARIKLLADVDLAVNTLTLLIQLFAFGHLIKKLGIRFMLISIPVLSVIGFIALAASPVLIVLLGFGVLRRAGEYAVSKPARESLFNVLPTEQKYKAKNVIDTVVFRGGDVASNWLITGLRKSGFSLEALYWLAVPVSLLWVAISWVLAGAAKRKAQALGSFKPSSDIA